MNSSERMPLVSIAMATYNCASTVTDSLESLAKQTYPNWELVVCDDASTDGTALSLEEFAESFPGRVTVLRNESNKKLAFSLNRCLAACRGEFVARMDGDDLCAPERLEVQVDFLQRNPDIDAVGSSIQRFDHTGLTDVVEFEERPDRWSLRSGVPFCHPSVMVRRRVYDELGGYTVSPRTVRGQDKDLWFRFYAAGFHGANLAAPLHLFREDLSAIKRRSARARMNSIRTSLIGYRMLGYPPRLYLNLVPEVVKILIPARGFLMLRKIQAWAFKSRESR